MTGNFKGIILGSIGAIGSYISSVLGGWSTDLQTLVIFMAIDFLTGFLVAGVFKKSGKSAGGALESNACFKGLTRKVTMLFFVLIAHRLDTSIGGEYIRTATIIGFIANEALSIIENAGLMGVPIPKIIKNAIEILKKKEDEENKK